MHSKLAKQRARKLASTVSATAKRDRCRRDSTNGPRMFLAAMARFAMFLRTSRTARTVRTRCVREASSLPVGVNLLANAGEAAIAVAKSAGGSFVRVNQFVNAYIANEGFVQGNSARVLRYRSTLHAQEIAVFADVHVKHGSHAIVADRPVIEQARDAEFFDADVTIATGNHTGDPTPIDEIENIRRGTFLPVIVGSGLSVDNANELLGKADGAIVGTSLKEGGVWWGNVSVNRVRALVDEVRRLRS